MWVEGKVLRPFPPVVAFLPKLSEGRQVTLAWFKGIEIEIEIGKYVLHAVMTPSS